MKTSIKIMVMTIFISYWSATVLFTLPDNYITISLYKYSQAFQLIFAQRWAFFAPPPTFDERLYYSYVNKSDSSIQAYEVFQVINEKKSKNAPFNWHDDIKDYLLSNSVIALSDMSSEFRQMREADDIHTSDSVFEDDLLEGLQHSTYFATLKNYAVIVAESNQIDPTQYTCIITLTHRNIPKFADRFDDSKITEDVFFRSKFFDL